MVVVDLRAMKSSDIFILNNIWGYVSNLFLDFNFVNFLLHNWRRYINHTSTQFRWTLMYCLYWRIVHSACWCCGYGCFSSNTSWNSLICRNSRQWWYLMDNISRLYLRWSWDFLNSFCNFTSTILKGGCFVYRIVLFNRMKSLCDGRFKLIYHLHTCRTVDMSVCWQDWS